MNVRRWLRVFLPFDVGLHFPKHLGARPGGWGEGGVGSDPRLPSSDLLAKGVVVLLSGKYKRASRGRKGRGFREDGTGFPVAAGKRGSEEKVEGLPLGLLGFVVLANR